MTLELGYGVGRQFLYWKPEHGFFPQNCPFKEYGKIYEWLAEMRYARNDARGHGLPVLTEPIEYVAPPGLAGVYAWIRAVGRAQERMAGRYPTFGHPNGMLSSQFHVFHPTWITEGSGGWQDNAAPPWPSLAYEQWVMEKDEFYYGPLQEAAQPYLTREASNPWGYVEPIGPGVLLNRVGMGLPILNELVAATGDPIWKSNTGWVTFEDPKTAKAPYALWQKWADEKRRWWRFRTTSDPLAEGSLDQVYVAPATPSTPAMSTSSFYEMVLARGVRLPDEPDWSKVDPYVFEGQLAYVDHSIKTGYVVIPK